MRRGCEPSLELLRVADPDTGYRQIIDIRPQAESPQKGDSRACVRGLLRHGGCDTIAKMIETRLYGNNDMAYPGTLMVAFAHSDDETSGMGGTLAWYAARGYRVVSLTGL